MSTESGAVAALVLVETREGELTPLSLELLGVAQTLREALSGIVAAVTMVDNARAATALIEHGADHVYTCATEGLEEYDGETWLPFVERLARELKPLAVLVGDTPAGADLAPRLAFRLKSAAATRCTSVHVDAGRLLFTRGCYGGNVRETVALTARPAVATMQAGVGDVRRDESRTGEVIRIPSEPLKRRARVVARERDAAGAKRLEDAKIIVAGGRGLEGPEGFRVLENLADVLGAAVGSSRVPCDLGWCPHSWQIGLTGKTVTPDLYVAIGISGAGHHMAGCGNARNIVAINTDPEAAIFREARFGVIGDYRKVVPAFAAAVAGLRQKAQIAE
jgi:electron transfer flavoprotein alpha subunit